MKSALSTLIALIAMAGLVCAQTTETFDGATTGSTAFGSSCASVGGWTYPTGIGENPNACNSAANPALRPDCCGTGSGGTGPSGDHTSGAGNYMYAETSGAAPGQTFHMYAYLDGTGGNMDFWYNMNGVGIGSLAVEIESASGLTSIPIASGDGGDVWTNSGPIALAPGTTCVRFAYTHGSSFTGDAAIDDLTVPGGFVAAGGNPVNANSPGGSLDINGSTAFSGCAGDPVSINFSGTPGAPFDIAVGSLALCGTPLIDDTIELHLGTAVSLFGGPVAAPYPVVGFGIGGSSMSFTFPAAAGSATLQGGAYDASDPDGIALTEVNTYDALTSSANLPMTLGDDASVQVFLGVTGPNCWLGAAAVNFYGTTYTDFYVGSNGNTAFTVGNVDFTQTSAEWQTMMPQLGLAGDLEPNNFGTVTVVGLADGFRVDYANVTEWGSGGLGVTSYSAEVSASAGVSVSGITTDGTWGATATVLGITNGSLGTHPGVTSFDALSLGGGAGAGLATDSWIDENAAGMILGAGSTVNNCSWPTADGSSILVN